MLESMWLHKIWVLGEIEQIIFLGVAHILNIARSRQPAGSLNCLYYRKYVLSMALVERFEPTHMYLYYCEATGII